LVDKLILSLFSCAGMSVAIDWYTQILSLFSCAGMSVAIDWYTQITLSSSLLRVTLS